MLNAKWCNANRNVDGITDNAGFSDRNGFTNPVHPEIPSKNHAMVRTTLLYLLALLCFKLDVFCGKNQVVHPAAR